MAKISDQAGDWLEDEAGHGIYDLAGMAEAITGAMTPSGTGSHTRGAIAGRPLAGATTPAGALARKGHWPRSLTGEI